MKVRKLFIEENENSITTIECFAVEGKIYIEILHEDWPPAIIILDKETAIGFKETLDEEISKI